MTRRRTVWMLAAILVTSVTLGTLGWAKSRTARDGIAWQSDLYKARETALATGRPMLIVFGAPWCGYCKKLERDVLSDSKVAAKISDSFVAVHLNYQQDREIAEILEVRSLPTTVILSPTADLLGSVVGYVDRSDYQASLKRALELGQTLRGGTR